jgi:1,4-dihydroxy-2-naphthoate octaprenyltransferase
MRSRIRLPWRPRPDSGESAPSPGDGATTEATATTEAGSTSEAREPGEASELVVSPAPDPAPGQGSAEPTTAEPAHEVVAAAPVSPAVAIMAGAYPTPPPQPVATPDPTAGEVPVEAPGADVVQDALALLADEDHAVVSWIDDDGYPVNVDIEVEVKTVEGFIRFIEPAGFRLRTGVQMAITSSHIYPINGGGFDERSHVTVWGLAVARPRGRFAITPARAWIWDQTELPPLAAYEHGIPQARRYYRELSTERRFRIRPELDGGQLMFRAVHSQFLGLAIIPALVGLALAARNGTLEGMSALLTLTVALLVFIGLSVAGGLFDPLQDASAGTSSRERSATSAILELPVTAVGCIAAALAIAGLLAATHDAPALITLLAAGLVILVAAELPPLRAAFPIARAVAAGIAFGPVALLGAYVVQSRGSIPTEALVACVPVGLLAALIPYVNEIPRHREDPGARKRLHPVGEIGSRNILAFDVPAVGSFVVIAAGVGAGVLPIPSLLALLAIPLLPQVHRGIARFRDNPYGLVPYMAMTVRVHMTVGLLLVAGYVVTLADKALTGMQPFLWR